MSILEQSKLKILSDNKIQLEYKVPIFIAAQNSLQIIDCIKIKVKYFKLAESKNSIYHLIPFKDRFIQILSQKLKIKKGNIIFQKKSGIESKEEYKISGMYCGIILDNKNWSREYKISKILKNE